MISPQSNFADLVKIAVGFINPIIVLLSAVVVVLFLFGVVRYIYHAGDSHSKGEYKEIMVWGLVALFVLFSIWGILELLNRMFSGGAYVPSSGANPFGPLW